MFRTMSGGVKNVDISLISSITLKDQFTGVVRSFGSEFKFSLVKSKTTCLTWKKISLFLSSY